MSEKGKRILELIEEIRNQLQPVIEHLLDLKHDCNADHLLTIRDEILPIIEEMLTKKEVKVDV